MNIKEHIEQHFNVSVLEIRPTSNGSGMTFDIITRTGRYIAKLGERSDFLSVYRKVWPVLEEAGLKQSHIVYSDDILTLYEWLNGETEKLLTPEKMGNAVLYIKRYNEVLKQISSDEIKIQRMNAWDDAGSLSFLLDEFPQTVHYSTFPCAAYVIKCLTKGREILENLPKQLIHSDLGADNFLFIDDKVNAIIDFTPQIAPEIYGLCQFLYWNVLWKEENTCSLLKWAAMYSEQINREVFYLLMLQTALFRVVGPLLNGRSDLEKRTVLLEELLSKV